MIFIGTQSYKAYQISLHYTKIFELWNQSKKSVLVTISLRLLKFVELSWNRRPETIIIRHMYNYTNNRPLVKWCIFGTFGRNVSPNRSKMGGKAKWSQLLK